jgi:hypothetical protein
MARTKITQSYIGNSGRAATACAKTPSVSTA